MAQRLQISLARILVAVTIVSVFLTCLRTEAGRGYVMPIAVAFLSGLLFPFGVRVGLALAAVIVVVNAVLMEKDQSGLGPNEVVIPFQVAVFLFPTLAAAWFGRVVRVEFMP